MHVGLDKIEELISAIENVQGQQVTAILMEKGGITAMRTWHVNRRGSAPPVDARYVIGDPRFRAARWCYGMSPWSAFRFSRPTWSSWTRCRSCSTIAARR